MEFRPASLDDADLLLEWRNDPTTRSMSFSTERIERATHIEWLRAKISGADSDVFIVSHNDVPVASIRCDKYDGYQEISWVVAPEHRNKGFGKKMLRAFVEKFKHEYVATMRPENIASKKICEAAGFHKYRKKDGKLYYRNF